MSNDDFDQGYDKGRRAVHKAAGWVAGLGAAILGPAVEKAGESADAARTRAAIRAQHIADAKAREAAAFDQRTRYLFGELERARWRRPRVPLGKLLFVISIGLGGAWLGWYETKGAQTHWQASLFFAAVALVFGVVFSAALPNREKRARAALRQHRASANSGTGEAIGGIILIVILVVWYLNKR